MDLGELFDPDAEFSTWQRNRPHRSQASAIVFLTIRSNDSIPAEVIARWQRERIDFLRRHGIECDRDWKAARELLEPKTKAAFDKQFSRARGMTLDECLGACELRAQWAAEVVAKTLMHFDQDRYVMGDFVVMPNHAHCLVAFPDDGVALKQVGQWMRYSANVINQRLKRTGALWFREPFDHLVRREPQLEYLRRYIEQNPVKAKLADGEFLYRKSPHPF